MSFPFFNPPGVQKRTAYERGDWFAPSGGIEPDCVKDDFFSRPTKLKKALKIVLVVFGVALFLYFGYLFVLDFYRGNIRVPL